MENGVKAEDNKFEWHLIRHFDDSEFGGKEGSEARADKYIKEHIEYWKGSVKESDLKKVYDPKGAMDWGGVWNILKKERTYEPVDIKPMPVEVVPVLKKAQTKDDSHIRKMIEDFKSQGIVVRFEDKYGNEAYFNNADSYSIFSFERGISIRGAMPKRLPFNEEFILRKIADKENYQYIDYSKIFKKLNLPNVGYYPTTYGVGVEVIFGNRKETIDTISDYLKDNGIEFTNEYSEAGWAYRFKISKSKENLDKIKALMGDDTEIKSEGGELKPKKRFINSHSVNYWDEVPSIWKNTKEIKKVKFENNPHNKELLNMLYPIAGYDELRPIMSAINFDDYGITVTNAHILVVLPYPNKDFNGAYATFPKVKYVSSKEDDVEIKDEKFIKPKYPKYKDVITESKDAKNVYKISVYKLLQYTRVALNYANRTTNSVNYSFGNNVIGFNGKFLIEILELALKLGYEELYSFTTEGSRAMVLSPDKDYKLGKSVILLVMPVIIENGVAGAYEIDWNRELTVYYDFKTDSIKNNDGSVANFKMNYGDYTVVPSNQIRLLNKFSGKNNSIPILDYFIAKDSKIIASDLQSSLVIKNTELKDGVYNVLNDAIEQDLSMSIDDYPIPNEVENPEIKFVTSSGVLKHYLNILFDFVSNDDLRPFGTGVLFDYVNGIMFMVATNYHIMSKIDITKYIEINTGQKDFKFIVKENNLLKFFNNIEESAIIVKASNKEVSFENSDYEFISKLIIDKYANYNSVIEFFKTKKIILDTKQLNDCINNTEVKKFSNKHKNEKIHIYDVSDIDGKLELYLGVTDSMKESPSITDKIKLCDVDYSIEEGDFQVKNSLMLLMPLKLNDVKTFSFDIKYLKTIVESVNCSHIDFLYSEPNKSYIVDANCLEYGQQKPLSISTKTVKIIKQDKPKVSKEIMEIQEMIELLKETLVDNPDDEKTKETLELLEETLSDLTNNPVQLEEGGNINQSLIDAINSTDFYLNYNIGYNPFELIDSKSYGKGIYTRSVSGYNSGRVIKIKPNVKNPVFFFNEKGLDRLSYREALTDVMKEGDVRDKNDFIIKLKNDGYDSMVVYDNDVTYLILFENNTDLYLVKSDLGI